LAPRLPARKARGFSDSLVIFFAPPGLGAGRPEGGFGAWAMFTSAGPNAGSTAPGTSRRSPEQSPRIRCTPSAPP
jgi:hypothetical protein